MSTDREVKPIHPPLARAAKLRELDMAEVTLYNYERCVRQARQNVDNLRADLAKMSEAARDA